MNSSDIFNFYIYVQVTFFVQKHVNVSEVPRSVA